MPRAGPEWPHAGAFTRGGTPTPHLTLSPPPWPHSHHSHHSPHSPYTVAILPTRRILALVLALTLALHWPYVSKKRVDPPFPFLLSGGYGGYDTPPPPLYHLY